MNRLIGSHLGKGTTLALGKLFVLLLIMIPPSFSQIITKIVLNEPEGICLMLDNLQAN